MKTGGTTMLYRSHRGGVYWTPENTMPAFLDAMNRKYDHIETDPCFTKDRKIVLLHDETLNRTCRSADGAPLSAPVYCKDLTYEELLTYDAGIAWGEQFRGTRIPLLEELLAAAEGTDIIIALDKKITTHELDPLLDLVTKYNTRVCFSCKDTERIRVIQQRLPDAMIDYDGNTTEEDLEEVTALVKKENLLVWLYMDKPNFAWLTDRYKVSPENCARVKKYARLAIGNINNPCDLREALEYAPDMVEV